MNPTPIIDMFSGTGELARKYVLSATHYFFVWPVESILCVRANSYPLLKKRS